MIAVASARVGGTTPNHVIPAPENPLKQTGKGRESPNMFIMKSRN